MTEDDKEIYQKGVAYLEQWEDVNYCEHSFKFKDEWLTDEEVVDLLNALNDENEQFKKEIERIDFILDDLNGAEYISRDDGIKALNKIDKVIGKR